MTAGSDPGPLVHVEIAPGVWLQVAIPAPTQRVVVGEFLVTMNAAIDRIAQRYAPDHRGFLTELRERVLLGIEPKRLGRGGLFSFVDRIAYRMWSERQTRGEWGGLTAADRVIAPAGETGEPLRGDHDIC